MASKILDFSICIRVWSLPLEHEKTSICNGTVLPKFMIQLHFVAITKIF